MSCLMRIILIAFMFGIIETNDMSLTVRYTEPYEIICELDELNKQVAWLYNNDTVFSCEPPYRSGQCDIRDTAYTYNVNSDAKTMTVFVKKEDITNWKLLGTNWTCEHDIHKTSYTFNNIESPEIVDLTRSEDLVSNKADVSVSVIVNSTEPYKVIWRSKHRGDIEIQKYQSSDDLASVSFQSDCRDNIDNFTCIVDNGVSFPAIKSFKLDVKCNIMLLEEEMNKTVEVYPGGEAVFTLLYTGLKEPNNVTWYRRMSSLDFLTNYKIKKVTDHNVPSMSMIMSLVQSQDAGIYTAVFDRENGKDLVDFELKVKTGEESSDSPFNGYVGIGIGAGVGIIICIVIFLAAELIKKICNKTNNDVDDYLTPDPVPSTPPPSTLPESTPSPPSQPTPRSLLPAPSGHQSNQTYYNDSMTTDSAFSEETYENF